jgi:hypothetical protein
MDSDPPLPPPLRIRHRSPTSSTSTTTTNNNSGTSSSKPRAHRSSLAKTYRLSSRFDDQSSQPSSDPALFSSDDIPASGLENYHAPASGSGSGTGSRKRRYRGTWWGEVAAPDVREVVEAQGYGYGYGNAHGRKMKRKRAEFKDKRLVDSGVWMGSDESGSVFASEGDRWGEELLGGSVEEDVRQGEGDNVHVTGNGNGSGMVSAGTRMGFAKKVEEESKEHRVARAIVNDCLERGEDSIDLRYASQFSSDAWMNTNNSKQWQPPRPPIGPPPATPAPHQAAPDQRSPNHRRGLQLAAALPPTLPSRQRTPMPDKRALRARRAARAQSAQ